MNKYRIRPYDVVHDIWLLQERYFFWIDVGVGSKAVVEAMIGTANEIGVTQ